VELVAEAAFERFVLRSGRSLLRTAWLLTGDSGHAEDLVQTALERTAFRWDRIDGEPEAYARRAVVNLATDRWRRRQARVPEVSLADLAGRSGPTTPDSTALVDLRAQLVAELRTLPPRERAVLVLRYFNDLDEAETARTLGVSQGTVKSSASRGLARLRAKTAALRRPSVTVAGPEGAP
jgi:RNA polymerase sigma-70 factor (sigma-E family)